MKKVLGVILLVFLSKFSKSQVIKCFVYTKSQEDSLSSIYSVRISLDKRLDKARRLSIVKNEFSNRLHISPDKLLQIVEFGSKKYKSFNYSIRVIKK